MTTPDELQRVWRAVEAIPAINDLSAQYQNDIAEAILSERAELLATVEKMRGGLEKITTNYGPGHLAHQIARAALTTGEDTTPNAGERG